MEHEEILKNLAVSFSELHDIDVVERLSEFCQGEPRILFCLYNAGRDMTPSDLSAMLHVSRARITAALANLRKKGFIRMDVCETDRRRMLVILTENGRRYIGWKNEEVAGRLNTLVSGLGEHNALELIRLIRLSVEVLSKTAAMRQEKAVSAGS